MAQNIRPATVAGKFYDADRESLIRTVARCYKKAETMAPLSREERDGRTTVQAVVVPHAGYVFSGAVAAAAYLRLDPEVRYKRIFLLGPSHHVAFDGASVASAYSAYSTPLGNVDVDTATCMALQQTVPSAMCLLPTTASTAWRYNCLCSIPYEEPCADCANHYRDAELRPSDGYCQGVATVFHCR